MSAQDKIERIQKQIHLLFSQGESVSGDKDKVIVDKKMVFNLLEQLNLAIYEMMDQYEATSQSRELAQRRSEKKGEEMLERISQQAEDVYAASLIYTDDALNKVQHLMENAMEASQMIWRKMSLELENEKQKVKEDQMELREQLQDFKDSNKYLVLIEERNRELEKQKKEIKAPEKRIQNEARHYPMQNQPEIRVNPAYFERRKQKADAAASQSEVPEDTSKDSDISKQEDSPVKASPRKELPNLLNLSVRPNKEETAVTEEPDDIPPIPSDAPVSGADDIPPMPAVMEEEMAEEPFVMPEIKVDLDAEYFKWQAPGILLRRSLSGGNNGRHAWKRS